MNSAEKVQNKRAEAGWRRAVLQDLAYLIKYHHQGKEWHEPSDEVCRQICETRVSKVSGHFRRALEDSYVRHRTRQLAQAAARAG